MDVTTTLVREFEFSAGHHLPNHNGKCRRPHGHNYDVHVRVTGPIRPVRGSTDDGMVIDFGDIGAAYKTAVDDIVDHYDLNTLDKTPIADCPTAERLAVWILNRMAYEIDDIGIGLYVSGVDLWETKRNHVEVRRG